MEPGVGGFRSLTATGRPVNDIYLDALMLGFAAYAILGKGFAYAGVPPLFVGELLLLGGLVTLVLPRPSLAILCTAPSLLLVTLIAWTVARTVPFVGEYKVEALRDSVIVLYGLFGLIVANLLLENPARIQRAVAAYSRFASVYGSVAAIVYLLALRLAPLIPAWPISGAPMLALRGGEVAVHIAGAATFAIVGLKKSSLPWIAVVLAAATVISAQNRGGMLAILVPVLAAFVLSGQVLRLLKIVLVMLPIVATLYAADVKLSFTPGERSMAVRQVVDNSLSIIFPTGNAVLDGTKEWRLRWWSAIVDYTVHGEYFWTGKGFGVNLAVSDGFVVGEENGGPPLRSPHNAHMTMLARSGVPGAALWAATMVSWLAMMTYYVLLTRLRGDRLWSALFVFITCYLLSGLINATFDVALEGPMMGIPFWCLFGAGIGLSLSYRAYCRNRRTLPQNAARRARRDGDVYFDRTGGEQA